MKKFASTLAVVIFLSSVCFGQSIMTVTPSNVDVGQDLGVSIVCSTPSMYFCPQLVSWRICDTIKRVYFQHGDSVREASVQGYGISNTYESTINAVAGFPLSSPTGAWDVVVEHKPSDSTIDAIQKMVQAGGVTVNALSNPVVDSIRPTVVYQNRKVIVDIFATHAHFKIVRQDFSIVNNIADIRLTRDASSIQADSFSIRSYTKTQAYFTLKNSADTGLYNLSIDQGSGLPSAVLQKAVSIKTAPSSPYSLPDGCMAFYPFEGDAMDRSYNGNNGVLSGAVTVDGIFGQALYFNGSSSSVSVPNITGLNVSNGLSISAWIKPEFSDNGIANDDYYCIVDNEYGSWQLGIYPGEGVTFTIGNTYTILGGNGLHINEWNHILATWDGAVMRSYINGVLQSDSAQLLPSVDNTTGELFIGRSADGYFFKGIIDEVMIFNRGLSAAEGDSIFKGMYLGNSQNDSTVPIIIPYKPKVTLDRLPKFAWNPLAGTTSYTFSAATNASFSTIILQMPISATTFTPSVNLPIGPVYWHVKSNQGMRWSLTDNFVIQSDTIPFIRRFDGAAVDSWRPTFVWSKVAKAATYRIEIASNSLYINPYLITLVSDTMFTPLGDLRTGVSYWHVSCDRNISLFCQPDSLVLTAKTFSLKYKTRPSAYSCAVKRLSKSAFIDYELPAASTVSIKLYSLQGKLLKEIAPSCKKPGYYESSLSIADLSRGYYLLDFKAGAFSLTKRISNF
jgi:hypothetical protein